MRLLAVLVALMLTLCPAPARGQMVMNLGNAAASLDRTPPFTRTELRVLDSILGLTDEQRELVQALHAEFSARYQDRLGEGRGRIEPMVEESMIMMDREPLEEAQAIASEFRRSREAMREEFIADLRLVLDRGQSELWPRVERELRRPRLLANGSFVGESVDLIALVDARVPLWTERDGLVEELDAYARRLDQAMLERDRLLDSKGGRNFLELVSTDTAEATRVVERANEARARVREVNTSTIARLRNLLPTNDAETLERAFYLQSIEKLVPESPITRRILASDQLESLTDEQRPSVERIAAEYRAGRTASLKDLFEAIAATQEDMLPESLDKAIRTEQGLPERDWTLHGQPIPIFEEALRRRLERDRRAWTALRSILTDEQIEHLPGLGNPNVSFPSLMRRFP